MPASYYLSEDSDVSLMCHLLGSSFSTCVKEEGARPGNGLWESRMLVSKNTEQAGLREEHGIDSPISRLETLSKSPACPQRGVGILLVVKPSRSSPKL